MIRKLLTIAAITFLIGAGCASDNPTQNTANAEEPAGLTELQLAYANCLEQGHKTTLKFDEEKSKLTLFCVFSEGKSCDALRFLNGTCALQKKEESNTPPNEIKTIDDIENENSTTRTCENTVNPVCGMDGFTYTNQCIAESQRIDIKHVGPCNDVEQFIEADRATGRTSASITNNNTSQANSSASPAPSVDPNTNGDWLEHVILFAQKEISTSPVTIQECTIGGTRLYHKTGDFSVLYEANSEVLCFPKNDLKNFCPPSFTPDIIARSCKTIWRK